MNTQIVLNLFHILVVAPTFLYVAVSRADTIAVMYPILMGLSAFIFLYHSYRAFIKFQRGSSLIWINIIHMFFVAPLLMFIGYNGKDTPRYAYELLALLSFAALGYHIYYIIQDMNLVNLDDKK